METTNTNTLNLNAVSPNIGKYAYGIAGLAGIVNCSLPTAQKIKNSGTIPYAQVGRKIIFEVDVVLHALRNKKRA